MNIKITGREEALSYVPKERTYGIRIRFSGSSGERADAVEFQRLESNNLYVPHVYYFDDVEPWKREEGISITRETAVSIIEDFRKGRDGCSTLLVHCMGGLSRSPAVAMGLNHIFKLGASNIDLAEKYPDFNIYVAQLLHQAAMEMDIVLDD